MFITPTDIANRALQHLGVPRIAAGALTTEQTKQAVEANFCYAKLRRAELQKSVWSFAVRRAVLRKIAVATTKRIVPAAWAVGTTYGLGDVVRYTDNIWYISNQAANVGNTPGNGGLSPAWSVYYGNLVAQAWDAAVAYIPGDLVWVTATAYICTAATTNNTPPNTTYWQPLTATLSAIIFFEPIGYKPDGSAVRNIYRLPANFLRMAPLDPKQAGTNRQNVAAGMAYNDYEFETDYLLSASQGTTIADPLVLRFVADQADVPSMEDTFCEALAARMAIELAEPLTQSKERIVTVTALYDNILAVAKLINAVEAGSTEPEPGMQTAPAMAAGGRQQGAG